MLCNISTTVLIVMFRQMLAACLQFLRNILDHLPVPPVELASQAGNVAYQSICLQRIFIAVTAQKLRAALLYSTAELPGNSLRGYRAHTEAEDVASAHA